jgi:hypothetical protein
VIAQRADPWVNRAGSSIEPDQSQTGDDQQCRGNTAGAQRLLKNDNCDERTKRTLVSRSADTIAIGATVAATRLVRSGSLRMIIAMSAPKRTLVSRSADTIAIGATVIAQMAMP